jgi:hypothetical protein
MSTNFIVSAGARLAFCVVATLLLTIHATAFASGTAVPATDDVRVSQSRQTSSGRDGVPGEVREDTFSGLKIDGGRDNAPHSAFSKGGSGAQQAGAMTNDFWFYTADVVLFNDDDNDGYFHGVDLLFDADTYYEVADVYAVAYLSFEGGPWNEYAVTDEFSLYGASSDDEYVIVTELNSGYPAGDYDLLIELFDAIDGEFLASFGPDDSSELAFLPLEDFNRDTPIVDEVIVIGHGGGGIGMSLLAALLMLASLRAVREYRRSAAVPIDPDRRSHGARRR